MALDTFKILDDEQDFFDFNPAVDEATALDAMGNALAARGIDINALNQEQTSILTVAAYQIESLLESQIDNLEEAQTFLGDSVELISEYNLQSTDGLKLNGLATQDGKIVLDSALVGDTFRKTLVEEMAELAFYAAFKTTSKGDFGAEVEARIEGDATAEELAQLSSDAEADTVQTAFGEGQANVSPWESTAQFYAEEVFSPQGVSVEAIKAQLDAWNGAKGFNNIGLDGQVFFNPSTVQKVEGTENLMNVIRSASANQKDAFGLEVRKAIPQPNMDLDGDGIRSSTVEALLIDHGPKADVIGKPQNIKYTPIQGLSEKFVANKGTSTNEWTARSGVEYKTEKKFEVADKNAIETSGNFNIGGISAGLKETNERTTSQATSTSNGASFFEQVTKKFTVDGSKYDPGTVVSYGYHVATGDLKAQDTQKMLIILGEGESTGVVQDTAFLVDVWTTGTLDNVGLGVVATDVEQGLWA